MNPLSPTTYYWRHKRSALLLLMLIALSTFGLYIMVSVLDSIPLRANVSYLTKVNRVYPASGSTLEPGIVAQIQTHPDIAGLIWDNGMRLAPPTLIGVDSMRLMGVSQEDAQYLMAYSGVRLKEGRMFDARTNEIVLSEELVRALGSRIVRHLWYGKYPGSGGRRGGRWGDQPDGPDAQAARVWFVKCVRLSQGAAYRASDFRNGCGGRDRLGHWPGALIPGHVWAESQPVLCQGHGVGSDKPMAAFIHPANSSGGRGLCSFQCQTSVLPARLDCHHRAGQTQYGNRGWQTNYKVLIDQAALIPPFLPTPSPSRHLASREHGTDDPGSRLPGIHHIAAHEYHVYRN